ncbi:hypothetical protein OG337_28880 [[Kitasatospora] papulosa]|uniref:hypothetical protein n=1 Tax=[Kitasatospora] papulosa TaxID=1464011 RepID=UPI0038634D3B|nr:hypothetical protein OG337_28880 [[Kitasatospora] papulosa]
MDHTQTLTAPALTPADVPAHQAASYVRRPVVVPAQESPAVPSEPAARRRFVAQRGW